MWNYLTSSLPVIHSAPLPHSPRDAESFQGAMQTQNPPSKAKKTLYIISHDRHTALSPPPDLQYDLRSVSNPPKDAREVHTGHSRQMRDGLLRDPRFSALLRQAEKEIRDAMRAAEEESQRIDEEEDGEEEGKEVAVRVGCLCGSGHHRSVAFSEQLARVEWPRDWRVELRHRDLVPEVKREKSRKRKRRRRKG